VVGAGRAAAFAHYTNAPAVVGIPVADGDRHDILRASETAVDGPVPRLAAGEDMQARPVAVDGRRNGPSGLCHDRTCSLWGFLSENVIAAARCHKRLCSQRSSALVHNAFAKHLPERVLAVRLPGLAVGDQQLGFGIDAAHGWVCDATPAALRRLLRSRAVVRFVLAAQFGVGSQDIQHFGYAMLFEQRRYHGAPASG
jgi:hypothetical protein